MEGDVGFPDLALARGGIVLLAEAKSDDAGSKPTPDQVSWLTAAGAFGFLWRPADLRSGLIARTLTHPLDVLAERAAQIASTR